MKTTMSVYVRSIVHTEQQRVLVTATNGGIEGPPSVTWFMSITDARDCVINKEYVVTIEARQ